jgi:hypothetical protein
VWDFTARRLRTSGSAWTARVGGMLFGMLAKAGIDGHCEEGSKSFDYAAPSDNVVPTRAKCVLFWIWLGWSRLGRRETCGKTISQTAFP